MAGANAIILLVFGALLHSSVASEPEKPLNILLLTIQASGHLPNPLALGEELVQRGHNVTLSKSGERLRAKIEGMGMHYISNGPENDFTNFGTDAMSGGGMSEQVNMFAKMREGIKTDALNVIKMFQGELDQKWDLILATDFITHTLPCLEEWRSTPVVMLHSSTQGYPHTFPSWPLPTGSTDNLSFFDRLEYALKVLISRPILYYMSDWAISEAFSEICPNELQRGLLTASSTRIPDIVPTVIGIEYARPISPLSNYVGPMITASPEPIAGELEEWLRGRADKSIILISMGSITKVTQAIAEALIGGVSQTEFDVIWALRKTNNFEVNVDPERVFISDWVPQLSVLQHPAIAMAIMHGGANGLHESLHSGVPMIVIPGMFEQRMNGQKAAHHGLAIVLEKDQLTSELVRETVTKITTGGYQERVHKLAKTIKMAGGAKRAADLVELYATVGYQHLIPAWAKHNWTWVQYYNVDVYILLLGILAGTLVFWYRVVKCLCCRSVKPKTE